MFLFTSSVGFCIPFMYDSTVKCDVFNLQYPLPLALLSKLFIKFVVLLLSGPISHMVLYHNLLQSRKGSLKIASNLVSGADLGSLVGGGVILRTVKV